MKAANKQANDRVEMFGRTWIRRNSKNAKCSMIYKGRKLWRPVITRHHKVLNKDF